MLILQICFMLSAFICCMFYIKEHMNVGGMKLFITHRTDYNIRCNGIAQKFRNFSFHEKLKSVMVLNRVSAIALYGSC